MLSRLTLLIVFLTFSLGQLVAIQKTLIYGFYLYDVVLIIYVLLGIMHTLKTKELFLPKSSFLLFIFSFIMVFSIVRLIGRIPTNQLYLALGYVFRWFIYLSAGLICYNQLRQKALSKELLIKYIILSTALVSLFGFFQLAIFPDLTKFDVTLGWDPHKNRLVSTFLDPNFVGAYITLGVICLTFFKNLYRRNIYILLYFIHVIALILTSSRSTWLMFALFIVIYGMTINKKLIAASFVIFILIYFAVPRIQTRISGTTDPADSAYYRFISWQNTFAIIKENYLFGVGYNRLRFVQKDYALFAAGSLGGHAGSGSDSSVLTIFVTTGVFGAIIFLAGYLYGIKTSLLWRSIAIPLLVESSFVNSLLYPQILFVWIVMLFSYSFFDK